MDRRRFLTYLMTLPTLGCASTPSLRPHFWTDRTMGWSSKRLLEFCGRPWRIRHSTERIGAGPNLWSDAYEHVYVDAQGALHLHLRPSPIGWRCVEIATPLETRYTAATFTSLTPLGNLDPNVIAAFFFYRNDSSEIDIEFARWGEAGEQNGNSQFVVAPPSQQRLQRFSMPKEVHPSTHSIAWQRDRIAFQSRSSQHEFQWSYTGPGRPVPENHWLHINLWLHQGRSPLNNQPVEWVIKDVFLR